MATQLPQPDPDAVGWIRWALEGIGVIGAGIAGWLYARVRDVERRTESNALAVMKESGDRAVQIKDAQLESTKEYATKGDVDKAFSNLRHHIDATMNGFERRFFSEVRAMLAERRISPSD